MKNYLFVCLFIFLIPVFGLSQEASSAKDKAKAPASARAQHREAKKKWKVSRMIEMEQKRAIKENDKRLQTKATLKRMRQTKRKSERMRNNRKEFFLVRWFKYKHH